jgi:hypothetical protein
MTPPPLHCVDILALVLAFNIWPELAQAAADLAGRWWCRFLQGAFAGAWCMGLLG